MAIPIPSKLFPIMNEKDPPWRKIATSLDEISFSPNGLAEIDFNGKTICIARHNNMLYACAQKCPHAGGILSEGYIDALGNIVCPLHHYKYNLRKGRNVSGEGYQLQTYPVERREDGYYIAEY